MYIILQWLEELIHDKAWFFGSILRGLASGAVRATVELLFRRGGKK